MRLIKSHYCNLSMHVDLIIIYVYYARTVFLYQIACASAVHSSFVAVAAVFFSWRGYSMGFHLSVLWSVFCEWS